MTQPSTKSRPYAHLMKKPEPQKSAARIEAARIAEAIYKLKRPDKVGVAGVGLGTSAGVVGVQLRQVFWLVLRGRRP